MRELTQQQTEAVLESALDAACAAIQAAIGQTHGDVAAQFFSGQNRQAFDRLMKAYLDQECLTGTTA